jgi:hypothetical protein
LTLIVIAEIFSTFISPSSHLLLLNKSLILLLQHSAELVYSRLSVLLGLEEKTGNAGGHRRLTQSAEFRVCRAGRFWLPR